LALPDKQGRIVYILDGGRPGDELWGQGRDWSRAPASTSDSARPQSDLILRPGLSRLSDGVNNVPAGEVPGKIVDP
jgi:hypothetical protein